MGASNLEKFMLASLPGFHLFASFFISALTVFSLVRNRKKLMDKKIILDFIK